MIEPVPFTAVAATLLVTLFLAPTTTRQDAAHLEPEKRAIAAIESLLYHRPRLIWPQEIRAIEVDDPDHRVS
jgi:hypothetical protein